MWSAPNGAGKTTLLKLLTGEIAPDEGSVRLAKTLKGVTIDQQRALLEPDKRVRDIIADGGDWVEVQGVRKRIEGYLKDYLFDPAIADVMVGALSGGERSRVLLAREFARASNLLVLDEPTNDLDLETLDLLQEVIADYDGTVLIVSHDRDFLDRTVTITVGLDGIRQGRHRRRRLCRLGRQARVARRPPSRPTSPASATSGTQATDQAQLQDQRDLDLLPGPGRASSMPRSPRPRRRLPIPISTPATRPASPSSPADRSRSRGARCCRDALADAGRQGGRAER